MKNIIKMFIFLLVSFITINVYAADSLHNCVLVFDPGIVGTDSGDYSGWTKPVNATLTCEYQGDKTSIANYRLTGGSPTTASTSKAPSLFVADLNHINTIDIDNDFSVDNANKTLSVTYTGIRLNTDAFTGDTVSIKLGNWTGAPAYNHQICMYEYNSGTDTYIGTEAVTCYADVNAWQLYKGTGINVPSCKSGLVYTGSSQTLVATSTTYTLTNGSRTNAGSQDVTVTPATGYGWSSGDPKRDVTIHDCNIAKATPTFTITPSSGSVVVGSTTNARLDITVNPSVGGEVTVVSSNSTVGIDNTIGNGYANWTNIGSSGVNYTVELKGKAVGTTTFTYTFSPDDQTNFNSKTVTYDLTVTEAAPVCFTITASDVNGTISTTSGWTISSNKHSATKSVCSNAAIGTLPSTTAPTGYTFAGWYYGNTNTKVKTTDVPTEDKTITAKYTINSYLVTANANGGTIKNTFNRWIIINPSNPDIASASVAHGNAIPVPTVEREGYKFVRWEYTAGGTGTVSGSSLTITQNTTISAVWEELEEDEYIINLDDNGATTHVSPYQFTAKVGDATLTPATLTVNPKREYTISGFALSADRSSDGATVSSTDAITVPYTLTGWYSKVKDGILVISKEFAFAKGATGYTDANSKWAKASNTTLYANWSSDGVKLPKITKDQYTCGWTTDPEGTKIELESEKTGYVVEENTTLYAVCEKIQPKTSSVILITSGVILLLVGGAFIITKTRKSYFN